MSSRTFADDDALLAALHEALAVTRAPAADGIAGIAALTAGAQAAFSFRTMEEELASLIYDSLLDADPVGAGRAAKAARTVVFESDAVSVEMEITDDGIVGQVAPPVGASVFAEASDGTRIAVVCDELGCFTLPTPGHGMLRLHIAASGSTAVTEWAHLDPRA